MSQINIGWVQNTSFFIYVCVVCMCEERKKRGEKESMWSMRRSVLFSDNDVDGVFVFRWPCICMDE